MGGGVNNYCCCYGDNGLGKLRDELKVSGGKATNGEVEELQ